jgi:hypothetical protein
MTSLASALSCPLLIHERRYRLKVIGPNAETISAEVINLKTRRNWSDVSLIADAVSELLMTSAAVPVGMQRSRPHPAARAVLNESQPFGETSPRDRH